MRDYEETAQFGTTAERSNSAARSCTKAIWPVICSETRSIRADWQTTRRHRRDALSLNPPAVFGCGVR